MPLSDDDGAPSSQDTLFLFRCLGQTRKQRQVDPELHFPHTIWFDGGEAVGEVRNDARNPQNMRLTAMKRESVSFRKARHLLKFSAGKEDNGEPAVVMRIRDGAGFTTKPITRANFDQNFDFNETNNVHLRKLYYVQAFIPHASRDTGTEALKLYRVRSQTLVPEGNDLVLAEPYVKHGRDMTLIVEHANMLRGVRSVTEVNGEGQSHHKDEIIHEKEFHRSRAGGLNERLLKLARSVVTVMEIYHSDATKRCRVEEVSLLFAVDQTSRIWLLRSQKVFTSINEVPAGCDFTESNRKGMTMRQMQQCAGDFCSHKRKNAIAKTRSQNAEEIMSDETRKVAVQNRWIDETRKKKSNRVTDLAAVSKKKDGDKNNWPDNWTERRNKWMNENSTKSSKNGVYDSTKKAVRAAKLTHTVMLRSVLLARSSLEDKSPEQFKVLKQRCFVPERPGPKMFKSAAHLYKQVNVCQTCYNMYVALDAERNNTAQLDTEYSEEFASKTNDEQVVFSKTIDSKAIDSKTIDSKTIDSKTIDSKAIDSKAIDSKAIDSKAICFRTSKDIHKVEEQGNDGQHIAAGRGEPCSCWLEHQQEFKTKHR